MNKLTGKENGEFIVLRIIYAIGFILLFQIVELAIFAFALVQIVLRIVRGHPDIRLIRHAGSLSIFAKELFDYITFVSEQKPFPFKEYPRVELPVNDVIKSEQ